jgi:hypothetical protein
MNLAPTWRGIAPLLIESIARHGDHPDPSMDAYAEVLRMATAIDEWNRRAPALVELLCEARECLRDDECVIADDNIRRALSLLGGDQ